MYVDDGWSRQQVEEEKATMRRPHKDRADVVPPCVCGHLGTQHLSTGLTDFQPCEVEGCACLNYRTGLNYKT